MPYTPPTRAALRSYIARDLRDPTFATFLAPEVDDLLNVGILDVSRAYPKELRLAVDIVSEGQNAFPMGAYSVFRVEVARDGDIISQVRQNDAPGHAQSGWDYHGGVLYLPRYTGTLDPATDILWVWGYWPRGTLHGDNDVFDGDAECEYAVRAVSTYTGYQRLQNDRSLFQQWRTNPLNSDVSPNQLTQLADFYGGQWERLRNRIRIIRRS